MSDAVIQTPQFDARFPNTNQSKNCWQNYVDFHRCEKIKGEGAEVCKQFLRTYRSLCPEQWVRPVAFLSLHLAVSSRSRCISGRALGYGAQRRPLPCRHLEEKKPEFAYLYPLGSLPATIIPELHEKKVQFIGVMSSSKDIQMGKLHGTRSRRGRSMRGQQLGRWARPVAQHARVAAGPQRLKRRRRLKAVRQRPRRVRELGRADALVAQVLQKDTERDKAGLVQVDLLLCSRVLSTMRQPKTSGCPRRVPTGHR